MSTETMRTVAATVVQVIPSTTRAVHMVVVQEERFGVNWMWDAASGEFEVGQQVSVRLLDGSVIDVRAGTSGEQQR